MAAAIDAKSGLLRTLDLDGDRRVIRSHHLNLPDDLQREYCDGLVVADPFLDALRERPAGRIVTNDGLVDPRALRRTFFYQHYMAPLDNHYIVGGFVDRSAEGRATLLGLHRDHRATRFSDRERDFIQLLAHHVRRAIRIGDVLMRARERADVAHAALTHLSIAAWLLDGTGRVLQVNRAAEQLLAQGRVLGLADGRLRARDRTRAAAFAALVEQACEAARGRAHAVPRTLFLPPGDGRASHMLAIAMPLPGRRDRSSPTVDEAPADAPAEARVAVYIGDPEDTGLLRPEVLSSLYGLTQAEGRLAVAIGQGRDLPELSDDWAVSTETLRSQLKAVFAKTGCHRQAELVRLLAGAPWKLAAAHDG
jgi:DNA-binding CsgD family transcriptional regulator